MVDFLNTLPSCGSTYLDQTLNTSSVKGIISKLLLQGLLLASLARTVTCNVNVSSATCICICTMYMYTVKSGYGLSFRLERLQLQTEVLGGGTEQPMVFETWPRGLLL